MAPNKKQLKSARRTDDGADWLMQTGCACRTQETIRQVSKCAPSQAATIEGWRNAQLPDAMSIYQNCFRVQLKSWKYYCNAIVRLRTKRVDARRQQPRAPDVIELAVRAFSYLCGDEHRSASVSSWRDEKLVVTYNPRRSVKPLSLSLYNNY